MYLSVLDSELEISDLYLYEIDADVVSAEIHMYTVMIEVGRVS